MVRICGNSFYEYFNSALHMDLWSGHVGCGRCYLIEITTDSSVSISECWITN